MEYKHVSTQRLMHIHFQIPSKQETHQYHRLATCANKNSPVWQKDREWETKQQDDSQARYDVDDTKMEAEATPPLDTKHISIYLL